MDKAILFDDELFEEFLGQHEDLFDALASLIEFKYTLTDQIRLYKDDPREEWMHRVTHVVIRAKSRIAQVKGTLRIEGLGEEMQDLVDQLREERDDD